MNFIFSPYNAASSAIIVKECIKFATSIGIATISGRAQSILRRFLQENQNTILQICRMRNDRVSNIRRFLRPAVCILNIAFFFRKDGRTLSTFMQKHFLLVVFETLNYLKTIEPFQGYIRSTEGLDAPAHVQAISALIVRLTTPLLQLSRSQNIWFQALGTAILEEFIFRAIVQEGLLRQLPKLGLRLTKLSSPDVMDSLIHKIIRITSSSLIFGLAHLHYKGTSRWIGTTLQGISFGYIHEHIGFLPAILSHFDVNFYAAAASQS